MKGFLYLFHNSVKFQINSFDKNFIKFIETKWESIRDCFVETFKLLKSFGLEAKTLSSNNAVLPILYFVYHKNLTDKIVNSVSQKDNRDLVKKWLLRALILRPFGGSGDTVLTNMRKAFVKDFKQGDEMYIDENIDIFPLEKIEKEAKYNQIIDDEVALKLEGEIIRYKIFEPTKETLGTYVKEYHDKFDFIADDQSKSASNRVLLYYNEWVDSNPGEMDIEKIVYLLKNTITAHKDKGWNGGWESRIHTQFNFLNELGLVRVIKGEKIKISDNGKLMIKTYENGYPIEDKFDETYEQSAFLNAFCKYQINNPYRKNTISVNFFPLVLNVIKYLDEKYNYKGITRQEITFIISWGNNDYKTLAELIYQFRQEFKFEASNEVVYEHAMNLMDDSTPNDILIPATKAFIERKKNDYKFDKLIVETPDEVIRKLRLTMLISLRGAGTFIDINSNEKNKIDHILNNYSMNINFSNEEDYFDYMGAIDEDLNFKQEAEESEEEKSIKEKAIEDWAKEKNWDFYRDEIKNVFKNGKNGTQNEVLKYIKSTVRLEFLIAVIIKKALPNLKVIANYKADDQGIPFKTAPGGNSKNIGADIDVYEDNIHALLEPTIATSKSFQCEHEITSIRNHLICSANSDINDEKDYKEWFALFIAPFIHREVGNQVAVEKGVSGVDIYPWSCDDFVEFSQNVKSIKDYKQIRDYVKIQTMPKVD